MIETEERPEVIERPAKRWRNKYRCVSEHYRGSGPLIRRGEIFWSVVPWPSKEVAEQRAADFLDHAHNIIGGPRKGRTILGREVADYLGAFPA